MVAALLLVISANAEDPLPGVRDDGWDRVFTRTQGWTGADGAYSIDLGGRTAWLYSDTWIGRIVDGKHAPGSRLVNNTVGVHPTAKPDTVRFAWGAKNKEGHPSAWVVPDRARIGPGWLAKDARSWFWILDGEVVRTDDDTRKLVFFLAHVGRRAGAKGVWSFEGLGGAIATVENFADDPADWKIRQHAIPHAIGRRDPRTQGGLAVETSWGAAVWVQRGSKGKADTLYVYGIRETEPFNKQLLLARVGAGSITDPKAWRFFDGAGWSAKLKDAKPIADGLVNELTIDRIEHAGKSRFVMTHSEPVFGPHIFVRTAPRPEGPWSRRQAVYRIPGLDADAKHFPYAAKAHAHLSRPGELLITYVVNSHDFWKMFNDARIYRPRFVRVPLDAIFGK